MYVYKTLNNAHETTEINCWFFFRLDFDDNNVISSVRIIYTTGKKNNYTINKIENLIAVFYTLFLRYIEVYTYYAMCICVLGIHTNIYILLSVYIQTRTYIPIINKLINCPVVIIICKYYCEVLLYLTCTLQRRAVILNNTIIFCTQIFIIVLMHTKMYRYVYC